MKIAICGSMQFSKEMLESKALLEDALHECHVPEFAKQYVEGQIEYEGSIESSRKQEYDLIRKHFKLIQEADAILVLNYAKKGVSNYVGANTFLEIGHAYGLGKKIFILNPLPDMPYIREELEAMGLIVLGGELSNIN